MILSPSVFFPHHIYRQFYTINKKTYYVTFTVRI